ncbi:MAG: DedA family protein [Limimaricola sp.]|uniref:YqaA family protein n=1 Tax=Limimaricola sp. TaxID=2211665 RepID=UPI001DF2D482|nr:YqaA family protein [Limimaricola sp.]MBI1418040.1 DedA family protein [Limimaricola sp.]
MLRRTYDWTLSLAQSPHALWALAVIAFVESSVFPIPPDVLMIPLILARPKRAFLIAGICTLASVLGGLLGYYIGAALFETVGRPIVEFYGKGPAFASFAQKFNDYGAWAVLIAGVTPFPFKIVTIASGATHLSLPIFVISSIIARGLRFFVVAALLWRFGAPIRDFIERRLGPVFIAFCILLVGGFWVATKI